MVKTLTSIFISFIVLFGISIFEQKFVNDTFALFTQAVLSLHDKTEAKTATFEDGTAIRSLWEEKKKSLQIWLPHTALQEVDYQLYEAVGFICVKDYESALPKIEVVLGMCDNIPYSYTFHIENIL
ncbi:MAG: DUF4363 family protein [Clostridia bacterium]|nr:DUF4363 family protein [Clostridia bacterium]